MRSVRAQRRVTQINLSKSLGLTRSSIANIESGRQRVMLHWLVQLAEELDIPVMTLLPQSEHAPRSREQSHHRLSHWKLHRGELIIDHMIRIRRRNERRDGCGKIEKNAFVASLLMSESLIHVAIKHKIDLGVSTREDLIQSLAKEFDVSTDAMGFRLINLGVFSS
ncbi:MAG: helix-turn-helix domain-containing protein [Sciscionella sp.]